MRKIFISYRRVDAEFPAGALGRDLRRLFGDERVFRDKEDVGGGVSWRKEVLREIDRDCALLVLIGREWANAKDAHGKRRLDNSDDPLRLEIADGLRDGATILPILLENAEMPSEEELPPELRPLAEYNALKLRDGDWQYDLDNIRRTLQKAGFKPVNSLPPATRREPQSITPGTAPQKATIGEIIPYALIALASFLCGIGVLLLMLWKAEALRKLGLIGNLYYAVLLPLGLCAAAFLFGVMRSFARYKGTQYGGTLELGGPIVAFVLVVGGGFILVPKPPSTFPLTVYVYGEARNDLVLRNSGRVCVDLDGDRQSRSIGENGEAYFPAIPDRFRGQKVAIWVDATGFESTIADQKERIDGASLYLPVRRKSGQVSGRVQDQDGNPIANADVTLAGLSRHSDAYGHFEFVIPGEKLGQEIDLQAIAPGHKAQKYKVVPDGNEVTVTLPTTP